MKANLYLNRQDFAPLKDLPQPPEVRINIARSKILKGIKKKTPVSAGQALAEPDTAAGHWKHASISGRITDISSRFITIGREEGAAGLPPEPVVLSSLSGPDLRAAARILGLEPPPVSEKVTAVVVNGLNSQPGNNLADALWHDYRDTLHAGLNLALGFYPNLESEPVIVRPVGSYGTLGSYNVVHGGGRYPASLPPMVKKSALKVEDPLGLGVLSLRYLYYLGRLARLGLPIVDMPLNVAGANYMAPVGVTAGYLLTVANLVPQNADVVVLGGPLRGRAIAGLDEGLPAGAEGLLLVKGRHYYQNSQSPACINCGRCREVCPARLRPNSLTRYIERGRLDRAAADHLNLCFECGLCAYYCLTRRPLIALIQMGKKTLGLSAPIYL